MHAHSLSLAVAAWGCQSWHQLFRSAGLLSRSNYIVRLSSCCCLFLNMSVSLASVAPPPHLPPGFCRSISSISSINSSFYQPHQHHDRRQVWTPRGHCSWQTPLEYKSPCRVIITNHLLIINHYIFLIWLLSTNWSVLKDAASNLWRWMVHLYKKTSICLFGSVSYKLQDCCQVWTKAHSHRNSNK